MYNPPQAFFLILLSFENLAQKLLEVERPVFLGYYVYLRYCTVRNVDWCKERCGVTGLQLGRGQGLVYAKVELGSGLRTCMY